MKPSWYNIQGPELEFSRVSIFTNQALNAKDFVYLRDALGYIERYRDGSWICYYDHKYCGFEPSAHLARERVELAYEEKIRSGMVLVGSLSGKKGNEMPSAGNRS